MRFSIITPTFRPGPWLKLCLASVADQDIGHEHIIQDAGSDDGTLDWLRSDGAVKVFVERDEGMYDAINCGLKRSQGELLAYLNSDEQYLPETLSKVSHFFDAYPEIDVLFGDALLTDGNSVPISYRRTILPWRSHVKWVHLNTLTCSTFFRRSVIERGHFFDTRWKTLGDAAWVERMLAEGIRMAVLQEPLAAFAFTGGNLGASPLAFEEICRFREGEWKRVLVPMVKLIHRFRKWAGGAYEKRNIEAMLYSKDSPDQRKRFSVNNLGFGWPPSS